MPLLDHPTGSFDSRPSDHTVPRTADDPLDDPLVALLTAGTYLHRPPHHEAIAVLLDDRWRGSTLVRRGRSLHADDVFELAADVAVAARPEDVRVVIVSSRPGRSADVADRDRWSVLDDLFHGCGLELVEWFVLGRGLDLPRERAGGTARWPPGRQAGSGLR